MSESLALLSGDHHGDGCRDASTDGSADDAPELTALLDDLASEILPSRWG
jgi:hypothetical protein